MVGMSGHTGTDATICRTISITTVDVRVHNCKSAMCIYLIATTPTILCFTGNTTAVNRFNVNATIDACDA
jgi:hypothetical protein